VPRPLTPALSQGEREAEARYHRFITMTRIAMLAVLAAIAGCDARPTPHPAIQLSEKIIPPAPPSKPTYAADVAPILEHHCLGCHGSSTKRGGIALDHDNPNLEIWGRVADALRAGSMPPKGRPRPSPRELATIADWLDAEVFRCSVSDREPGRVTMRRLNRAEYDNTIRDLLGLGLHLADAFPADDVGYGFDNIGDVLSIPPILMEKYLRAADLATEQASRDPRAWSRIMTPGPDAIPPALRKPTFASRTEPVKRIGRPAAPPAPIVEDPEVIALRRAHDILRGFADRAFRRPASAEELTRLVGLVDSARKEGDTFDEAIRYAIKAILISPSFLFHVEEEPESSSVGPTQPLGDFELAARLSYFLWSSLPDDTLYRLAARGELRQGDNLARQVRRMLRDDKARALVDGFASQWLQIRRLGEVTPDPSLYPGFDESLRRAMLDETSRFAASILLENGRIFDFLDADYTFVNERLASHYNIPGVVGDQFRRVELTGTGRGGVLTHASVLTVTSNPTRTSPVKRGKWVLDNLLGMPPPPPPEGVEGLNGEEAAGRSSTLRQKLERHRENPKCASCHDRMDPPGFALESFDGIGARRTSEQGEPIDDSGKLPGGESFRGPAGLRDVLASHRQSFARCLSEKLLTYALGRGVGSSDRCFVDEIVRKLKRGDGRSSALIIAIVESPAFQARQRSKESP
jgi:mono/diheme cytochrome c family protein